VHSSNCCFRAISKLVEATNKESGCLYFQLFEPRESPNAGRTFKLLELWKDQAALDFHMETAYVKEFLANWENMKEKDLEVTFLEPAKLL